MKLPVRFLAMLLALAIFVAIASACGPATGNGNSAGSPAESSSPSSSATGTSPAEVPGASTSTSPSVIAPPSVSIEPPPDQGAPKYGGVYISAAPQEPSMLFANYRPMNGYTWITPAVESLGQRHPVTNEIEPLLAESFERDGNDIIIKLKEGIRFSDGSEFTSDVVRWNFEMVLENGLGNTLLDPVGFECPDKYTIIIKYDVFYLHAFQPISERPIYSQKAYEDNGLDWCLYNPVGTGPYLFKEYIIGSKISYVRRDDYWREGLPYLDGWEIHMIPETATAMTAFDNNEITAFSCSERALNEVIQAMGHKDVYYPTDAVGYISMAVSNKDPDDPWYKKEVRQAVFLYGLNHADLAMLAYGPAAKVWHQTGVEGALVYDPEIEEAYVYDQDRALRMLAEAGYPNGFTTDIIGIASNEPFMTALQDALLKLNITANIKEVNATDPVRMDGSHRGLVVLNGMTNWDGFIRPIGSMYNSFVAHYCSHVDFSDEYDELYLKGRDAETYEERAEAGKKLAHLLHVEECYVVITCLNSPSSYRQEYARGPLSQYNVYRSADTWFDLP